jgi:CheY-like chemotaxis protein
LNKNKVDIILMDISIWGKKNGLELTKELKASKEFSHIPVIAVTAHAFEEDKQNALRAGCEGYLAKPFSKEILLNMIAGFVG